MTKYDCKPCSFFTNNKTDYSRHIKTNKHKKKVNTTTKTCIKRASNVPKTCIEKKIHMCPFCENTYSSSSTLSRHKKACNEKE